MQVNYFDPIKTPLQPGINLLEASAGTGKTYAIAMLVLRFVVEFGIPIEQLLIVTFTKAATEELKERIRCRLSDAKQVLAGQIAGQDSVLLEWLASQKLEPETIKQRLTLALLDIDQASIFTIHGFCQRMLREHALASGQLFDVELTGDLATIKQACVDDFWRKQLYNRDAFEVAVLTADFSNPDALFASVAGFNGKQGSLRIYPELQNLDDVLVALKTCMGNAKAILASSAAILQASFSEQKFKNSYCDSFAEHCQVLANWLAGDAQIPGPEAFVLLTENGVLDGLHGGKFRATKSETADQRKQAYLAQLEINTQAFDDLLKSYRDTSLTFRRLLLETLQNELDQRLQQLNVLSFDELITRLAEALAGSKGLLLSAELQSRYVAALIDEFQDTDTHQWSIFSSVFATEQHYLYLIGDPKQAIYKFRGADIYSYLTAQKAAQHRYSLAKNWRSHPQLVAAVNALFQRERAFLLDDLVFQSVTPGKSKEDGELHCRQQALAPMMLWQLPESGSGTGFWTAGKAQIAIEAAVVSEILELLSGDYCLQPGNRSLRANDIAILVRTNAQARAYQAILRAAGLPSVLNSTESVFVTQEAADLYILLQAVANPGNSILLKQALALDWFGLNGSALYQLFNNEIEFDQCLARFLIYFQDWQQNGLMAMLLKLLEQESIRVNIGQTLMAERKITNLHQLIELLQQAALDEHLGIAKTLDWLKNAMVKASVDDHQQLRLESDEETIKIVTMHRAKGLEYPVVFCPCLWQRSEQLRREKALIQCHVDEAMIADLGAEQFEAHRKLALFEELAEDLRVFYVAVTRAKFRCYVVWANVRSEQVANDSAMAWLLDFGSEDFARQQAILQDFKHQDAQAFDYQLLMINDESQLDQVIANSSVQYSVRQDSNPAMLQAKTRQRSLYSLWQMSSYTALSALSQADAPELPEDKAREQLSFISELSVLADSKAIDASWEQLPKGAATGNVVHALLETHTFLDLAHGKDISRQRDASCLRYGLKLEQPELLDKLLQTVVTTPLAAQDPAFCLMNLPERECLKEMPFYLSMQMLDARQINVILADSSTFQALSSKVMCGYLTGFIDLICAYQGRYYVMDYKTNSLDDYTEACLTLAMREHNYGLQYWLYTVVLHRYLQARLPGYDFEKHFGGVYYLFVRGMQLQLPASGVFWDRPDLARIERLAALFDNT